MQIAGLFLCGLALEKLFSRRAALIAVLLVGTAPWFLSSGRLALELVYSSVFISGAVLYCLALSRRHYLAGAAAGALLGLGVIIHVWWLHAAAGLGLAALIMRGKRLFSSRSFWLCLLGFFLVAYLNLGQFAGDKSGQPGRAAGSGAGIPMLSHHDPGQPAVHVERRAGDEAAQRGAADADLPPHPLG